MTMERQPARSKGVHAVAYDPERRTLDVEFAGGKVYRYFEVSPDVYAWLMRVESKGRFINRLVRDKYRYERVEPEIDPDAAEANLLDALQRSLDKPRDDR
jgi:KTSC domain-containing protein